MEMALPAGTSGWLMPRNVPLPEKPENRSDDEAAELFENVLAHYIWRHMHVSTRAQISLPVWKECFSMAVECNWLKVISLFDAVFNEYGNNQTSLCITHLLVLIQKECTIWLWRNDVIVEKVPLLDDTKT
jgi:hypothetical protein